ncbi:MAG: cobalt ABC transporter ATP-binding protein [Armatimonadetes bacterium CG07_land_8_20_14_0_80_59_28]|nr:MAG: cobalt ABC transporter ATP-binding protein [Armatimonadetes bacterium CG07_land_8_20_14_0_80_59_28]PIX38984.1 MAG: cobalt ABC transporter ATP-binding protein [Armatimonadetes bacterium CG_4_8_14_3_um_filter_58_9]PIY44477.1 MAG: cobalt ABC transporter ATP-binding protein [Armatimonadetes bacterium CG_4_10_14_3_um_filter_59_10]
MSDVVRCHDLHFSYPDGRKALRGITLDISAGGKVGLIGPNGAGKSTFLLHLNGLLTGAGDLEVCGLAVEKRNLTRLRQRVGLVFQNPDDQLFLSTVAEDVAFGLIHAALGESEVKDRVDHALNAVGLPGFGTRATHTLSLGEKKRVSLATVLSMDCELLALDEPTSGLDPRGRGEVLRMLRSIPATQLVATHDLELVAALCERCIVMDEGRVVAQGATGEILSDVDLLRRHGLLFSVLAGPLCEGHS